MMPLVISYYATPVGDEAGYFRAHAAALQAECDALGVRCCIEELDNRGDWFANLRAKPEFIHRKLEEQGEAVLWVDCDKQLIDRPYLGEEYRLCDWASWTYKNDLLHKIETHGTRDAAHFFNPTEQSFEMLRDWMCWCQRPEGEVGCHGKGGSHGPLGRAYHAAIARGIKHLDLQGFRTRNRCLPIPHPKHGLVCK